MTGPSSSGRRVLLTGVSRPIMARMARSLADRDDVDLVVGVDTHRPDRIGAMRFLRAELDNPVVGATMADQGIDTLVHAGMHSAPRAAGGRRAMKERNVIGSMQLFAAAQHATELRHVVLKSFTAVYGSRASDPGLFTEASPVDRSASGFTRDVIDVEGYATSLVRRREDLGLTTLRFANFVGGVEDSALSGYFSLPIVPSVLGFDPRLQFCHADDAVEAVTRAVLHPHPGLYNVAGPGTVYLSQAIRQAGRLRIALPSMLVNSAADVLNRRGRVDVPTDQLTFLLFGRVVDTSRLVEAFGWEPAHSTPQAFAAFLQRRRDRGVTRRDLVALQRLVSSRLRQPAAARGGR